MTRPKAKQQLICCCCGNWLTGRQWHNRDKGFGICTRCVTKELEKVNLNPNRDQLRKEFHSNYGYCDIHWGLDLFIKSNK